MNNVLLATFLFGWLISVCCFVYTALMLDLLGIIASLCCCYLCAGLAKLFRKRR